jgi:hypothetical protein
MNTQILSIQQEFISPTGFKHLEVAAVNYKGSSAPKLKVRLYNSRSEFNLFLHSSLDPQSYPKLDLLAIAHNVPGLAHSNFDRIQFSIQDSNSIAERSDVTLELLVQ